MAQRHAQERREGQARVLKKNGSPQLEYPDKDEFSDPFDRFTYGIPPFSNRDFVFLQHIVASLNDTGRAGVVCPQGVLFRGQPAKTEPPNPSGTTPGTARQAGAGRFVVRFRSRLRPREVGTDA